jgi:hypothetical protein
MLARFDYTLTQDEYVRGIQATTLSLSHRDRWRSWRCLALFAVIGLGIAIAAYTHPGSLDGIMFAFILIWFSHAIMQARFVRRWRELAYDPAIAHHIVEVSDGGLSDRHDRGASEWSWDAVCRIHEMPDTIVVEVSNWHAITLPNRLWADVAEREGFLRFLRVHASKASPDLPKSTVALAMGSGWLTLGAIAAAFDLFLLTNVAVALAGFDLCSCAVRRTIGFHVFALSMVVATVTVFIVTKRGLERLNRSRPRLALGIAVTAICLLAAILLAGKMEVHYRPVP